MPARRLPRASSPAAPGGTSTGCARSSTAGSYDESELLLLADAQTSGGLLLAGEIEAARVIGEFVPARTDGVTIALR